MLFDRDRERVVGAARLWYQDLSIREDANQPVQIEEASKVLFEAIRRAPSRCFWKTPPRRHGWPAMRLSKGRSRRWSGRRWVENHSRS